MPRAPPCTQRRATAASALAAAAAEALQQMREHIDAGAPSVRIAVQSVVLETQPQQGEQLAQQLLEEVAAASGSDEAHTPPRHPTHLDPHTFTPTASDAAGGSALPMQQQHHADEQWRRQLAEMHAEAVEAFLELRSHVVGWEEDMTKRERAAREAAASGNRWWGSAGWRWGWGQVEKAVGALSRGVSGLAKAAWSGATHRLSVEKEDKAAAHGKGSERGGGGAASGGPDDNTVWQAHATYQEHPGAADGAGGSVGEAMGHGTEQQGQGKEKRHKGSSWLGKSAAEAATLLRSTAPPDHAHWDHAAHGGADGTADAPADGSPADQQPSPQPPHLVPAPPHQRPGFFTAVGEALAGAASRLTGNRHPSLHEGAAAPPPPPPEHSAPPAPLAPHPPTEPPPAHLLSRGKAARPSSGGRHSTRARVLRSPLLQPVVGLAKRLGLLGPDADAELGAAEQQQMDDADAAAERARERAVLLGVASELDVQLGAVWSGAVESLRAAEERCVAAGAMCWQPC